MRILVTSPGGIGDFVFRQPFFSVLVEHGHELLLAVPGALVPLARLTVREARTLLLPGPAGEPSGEDADAENRFRDRVAEFAPELIVPASCPPTPLDEEIARWFPEVSSIVLTVEDESGEAAEGPPFKKVIRVAQGEPERERYAVLAAAILGWRADLPAPAINLDEETLDRGMRELERLGVDPAACWIVCAGHPATAAVRNWEPQQWADLLASICRRHDLQLLFCGVAEEHPVAETIRERMGGAKSRSVNLCRPGTDLTLLAGLLAQSAGYLGRLTGPAYMAAALGKPIVAVSGAGEWPVSLPVARGGAVLTMLVPCAGCGWDCHLSEPYCVRRMPVEEVEAEFDRVLAGEEGFHFRALEPDRFLLHRIVEDGAALARERKRRFEDRIERLERDRAALQEELAAAQTHLTSLRDSVSRLERQTEELRAALKRAEEERLRQEFNARDLAAKSASWQAEAAKLEKVLQALKEENARLAAETHGLLGGLRRSVFGRLVGKFRNLRARGQ